jgi:hypothetical protein
LFDLPD